MCGTTGSSMGDMEDAMVVVVVDADVDDDVLGTSST
jgi:hypothetical protein